MQPRVRPPGTKRTCKAGCPQIRPSKAIPSLSSTISAQKIWKKFWEWLCMSTPPSKFCSHFLCTKIQSLRKQSRPSNNQKISRKIQIYKVITVKTVGLPNINRWITKRTLVSLLQTTKTGNWSIKPMLASLLTT